MPEYQVIRDYMCASFRYDGVNYDLLDCGRNKSTQYVYCCGNCTYRECCYDFKKKYTYCPVVIIDEITEEGKTANSGNSVSLNTIVESTTLSISLLIGVLLLLVFLKRKLNRTAQVSATGSIRLSETTTQMIVGNRPPNQNYPRYSVHNNQLSLLPPAYDSCLSNDKTTKPNEAPEIEPPPLYPVLHQKEEPNSFKNIV